tara:strand:- start:546 stop:770 length:225 start_codon:yes stop_codon:yes gene_type:complete
MISIENKIKIADLANKNNITADDYKEIFRLRQETKPHNDKDELFLLSIDEVLDMKIIEIIEKEGNDNFLEEEDK